MRINDNDVMMSKIKKMTVYGKENELEAKDKDQELEKKQKRKGKEWHDIKKTRQPFLSNPTLSFP